MFSLDVRLVEVVMDARRELACRGSVPGKPRGGSVLGRWLACRLGVLFVLLGQRLQRYGSSQSLTLAEGRVSRLARA